MGLNFSDNGEGIVFAFTKDSRIENVITSNNSAGIKCVSCENDSINQATLSDNARGIELSSCQNMRINGSSVINVVLGTGEMGFELSNCSNVTVSGNTVEGYGLALYLDHADGNTFYHNNIINDSQPAYAVNSFADVWDNGFHGNYWSAYNGTDADGNGIGDTQYLVADGQADRYPLAHPYVPDVAVTNVTANQDKAYAGQVVRITATVVNKWYENATFKVSAYADSLLIQVLRVSDLPPYTRSDLTLYWNASSLVPGNYTIRVQADFLPGEMETSDNVNVDLKIQVVALNVDFDGDGNVCVLDLRKAAMCYGYAGSCLYDVNFDNIVNKDDLELIVVNFGNVQ
jgi:parallel beta-helix repeat protein